MDNMTHERKREREREKERKRERISVFTINTIPINKRASSLTDIYKFRDKTHSLARLFA